MVSLLNNFFILDPVINKLEEDSFLLLKYISFNR